MKEGWKAGVRRLFRWEPPEVGVAEAFLQRLGVALVLYFMFSERSLTYQSQPHPNGLAAWGIDFTFVANGEIWVVLWRLMHVALLFYVAGIGTPVALGYVLFVLVSFGTLRNSQGNIHHGTQATTCVILAQFIAYAIAGVRRRRSIGWAWGDVKAHTRAFFYSQQALAAGYICAGIMKIDRSGPFLAMGLKWLWDLPNISLMVARNGIQHYYSWGTEKLAAMEHGLRMGEWIAAHAWLSRALFAPGLYVELVAFLVLFNRKLSFAIGVIVVVMHWLIGYVMQLGFPLNEMMLWLFFVNVPFLMVAAGGWVKRRGAGLQPGAEPG